MQVLSFDDGAPVVRQVGEVVRPDANGTATGRTVVMMAGVGGSTAQFERLSDELQRQGANVFVVPAPRAGWGSLGADVARLRDAVAAVRRLTGAERVSLVGHSKGGVAAVEVARLEPEHVEQVVSIASAHRGVGPSWARGVVDRLPFLPGLVRDMVRGSEALAGQQATVVPVTSVHHESSDLLTSASASRIFGPLARNVTFTGEGWRGTHPFNVNHHEGAIRGVLDALHDVWDGQRAGVTDAAGGASELSPAG